MFGVDWAQKLLIPRVLAAREHTNYLYRMTVLFAVGALAPVVGAELLAGTMLPMVLDMAKDIVPNVRFNAAKTLEHIMPLLDDSAVQECVKPCLVLMSEDPDHDVSYFATQGLHSCDTRL